MQAAIRRVQGFSLVEMSIVILIIGVVITMGVIASGEMLESARKAATSKKMDEIENALMSFRDTRGRLPCPANAALPNTDGNFGLEGVTDASAAAGYYSPSTDTADAFYNCISLTPGAATANFYWGAGNVAAPAQIAEGAVPVRTLGLPDDFSYDGWGSKIMYAVDAYATIPNAFNTMRPDGACYIQVTDAYVNDDPSHISGRTAGAVYVLSSYGSNKHGGFKESSTRYSADSSDLPELANCHCDASGADDGIFFLSTY